MMYFLDPKWIDEPFNLDFRKVPEYENFELINDVHEEGKDKEEVGKIVDKNVEGADDKEIEVNKIENNRTRSGRVIKKTKTHQIP
jgi:hypothetical protein